jgi:hypothetical protein
LSHVIFRAPSANQALYPLHRAKRRHPPHQTLLNCGNQRDTLQRRPHAFGMAQFRYVNLPQPFSYILTPAVYLRNIPSPGNTPNGPKTRVLDRFRPSDHPQNRLSTLLALGSAALRKYDVCQLLSPDMSTCLHVDTNIFPEHASTHPVTWSVGVGHSKVLQHLEWGKSDKNSAW